MPVTEADRTVDAVLRKNLLRDGEGWLSEESVDDFSRLGKQRAWVVDPLGRAPINSNSLSRITRLLLK